jgi:hypothetical protein
VRATPKPRPPLRKITLFFAQSLLFDLVGSKNLVREFSFDSEISLIESSSQRLLCCLCFLAFVLEFASLVILSVREDQDPLRIN